MLELIGRDYVIDHCISVFKREKEEGLYKRYLSTALYAISNNIKMLKKYDEIVNKMNEPTEPVRDGKQTAQAVADRLGIKINWGR